MRVHVRERSNDIKQALDGWRALKARNQREREISWQRLNAECHSSNAERSSNHQVNQSKHVILFASTETAFD
jgi:hypothetical protein